MHTFGPSDVGSLNEKIRRVEQLVAESPTQVNIGVPGVLAGGSLSKTVQVVDAAPSPGAGGETDDIENGSSSSTSTRRSTGSAVSSSGAAAQPRPLFARSQYRRRARSFVRRVIKRQTAAEQNLISSYVDDLLKDKSFSLSPLAAIGMPAALGLGATGQMERHLYRDVVTIFLSAFRELVRSMQGADVVGHDLHVAYDGVGSHFTTRKARVPWNKENRDRINAVVKEMLSSHPGLNSGSRPSSPGGRGGSSGRRSKSSGSSGPKSASKKSGSGSPGGAMGATPSGSGSAALVAGDENNLASSAGSTFVRRLSTRTNLLRGRGGEAGLMGTDFELKFAQELACAIFRIAMDLFSPDVRCDLHLLGHKAHWTFQPSRTTINDAKPERKKHQVDNQLQRINYDAVAILAEEFLREKRLLAEAGGGSAFLELGLLPEGVEREVYEWAMRLAICILENALLSSEVRILGSKFRFSLVENAVLRPEASGPAGSGQTSPSNSNGGSAGASTSHAGVAEADDEESKEDYVATLQAKRLELIEQIQAIDAVLLLDKER